MTLNPLQDMEIANCNKHGHTRARKIGQMVRTNTANWSTLPAKLVHKMNNQISSQPKQGEQKCGCQVSHVIMVRKDQLKARREINTVPKVPWHGPQVWMHFVIGASERYYAIHLLWTYGKCFAEFIVHAEKMYWMRHLQFMMIGSYVGVLHGPRPPRDLACGLQQA